MARPLRALAATVALSLSTLFATRASAADVSFPSGSLIVPMDVDYQNSGMLRAFGLLDKLLRAGVRVHWVIKTPKTVVDVANGKFEADFTATAKDLRTGAAVTAHAYRGGPFVITAADAAKAKPVITAWQVANPTTAVHETTAAFTGNVSKTLTVAPRIAIFADGNEDIAFQYLNAAGIPDEGDKVWAKTSVNVLTPAQIMGPTTTNHTDGMLFRPSGKPAYCELMTMHWKVDEPEAPEVTAEIAQFLRYPTHVNAECQAVNALEGAPPVDGRSNFVTSKGFLWPAPKQPATVEFLNSSLPFAQMDGPFKTVGGSEPAYALGPGSTYYDTGIVMVRGTGAGIGKQDVWMTGYASDGITKCPITDPECISGGRSLGKVSYLGGHAYDTKVPMTANPTTQGTRLFLNSLYEAGCVTTEGQPEVELEKVGPATTFDKTITYAIVWRNLKYAPANALTIRDTLPPGSTFVSATAGGTYAAGVVTWSIGDVANATGSVSVTLSLPTFGTFTNTAVATYEVGLAKPTVTSNTVTTIYADCATSPACFCADGGTSDACAPDAASDADDAAGAADTSVADSSIVPDASDASTLDASTLDASTLDASTLDASTLDASTLDASALDAIASADVADGSVAPETSLDVGSTLDTAVPADGSVSADASSPPDDVGTPAADAATGNQGGCGCTLAPTEEPPGAAIALLALMLVARRRRSRTAA